MTTIAPWLSVSNAAQAIEFYKSAFGAAAVYSLGPPDEIAVARLAVDGAEFWISVSPETLIAGSIRMILSVDDPDAVFQQAVTAGATEIHPMSEQHGWRVGRIADPFGHHWEVARQLTT